jgi:hypothetical protein
MTWLSDFVEAAPGGALWPVALIPAAFVVCFVVRIERWYRLISRAVEAIRSRIAEGGQP